jgi:hypothetical protein
MRGCCYRRPRGPAVLLAVNPQALRTEANEGGGIVRDRIVVHEGYPIRDATQRVWNQRAPYVK